MSIMNIHYDVTGLLTVVCGLQELGREEGGSKLIAHILISRSLPVADNWIDEDAVSPTCFKTEKHILVKYKSVIHYWNEF